ncbi:MAG: hypothetical protein H7Y88_06225 [Phycisphaerales bacterium]|nr:hypothetical protein [Phycisphaerales bacterium]
MDDDHEGPSQADIERFSNITRTCRECKKEVFDDAAVCYHCGHAFGAKEDVGMPTWALVTTGVILVIFLVFIMGGGNIF